MSLTLVLGGIRSGKSDYAVDLARRSGGRIAVVVTGRAGDEEMRRRIEAHRASRPPEWSVHEEPAEIATAVPPGSADVILLDSVDSWLANQVDIERCVDQVLQLAGQASRLIAVSSEVGLTLVALTPAGRAFTDALGTVNRSLAAAAEEVVLVVAGIPLKLKETSHS